MYQHAILILTKLQMENFKNQVTIYHEIKESKVATSASIDERLC